MLDRRCQYCEARISPTVGRTLLTVPLVFRYQCVGCKNRFEVFTAMGNFVLGTLSVTLTVYPLATDKWAGATDRWIGLTLLALLSLAGIGVLVFGHQKAQRNPLVES